MNSTLSAKRRLVRKWTCLVIFLAGGMGSVFALELTPLPDEMLTLVVGQEFNHAFWPQGAAASYSWTIAGQLPPGILFWGYDNAQGSLQGYAREPGTFSFSLVLTEGQEVTTWPVTMTVTGTSLSGGPLCLAPIKNSSLRVVKGDTAWLEWRVTGGSLPLTLTQESSLPEGMECWTYDNGSIILQYTPPETGSFPVRFQVVDGVKTTASLGLILTVVEPGALPEVPPPAPADPADADQNRPASSGSEANGSVLPAPPASVTDPPTVIPASAQEGDLPGELPRRVGRTADFPTLWEPLDPATLSAEEYLFTGLVRDQEGSPVPGATVRLFVHHYKRTSAALQYFKGSVTPWAFSDREGRFVLRGKKTDLKQGAAVLAVYKSCFTRILDLGKSRRLSHPSGARVHQVLARFPAYRHLPPGDYVRRARQGIRIVPVDKSSYVMHTVGGGFFAERDVVAATPVHYLDAISAALELLPEHLVTPLVGKGDAALTIYAWNSAGVAYTLFNVGVGNGESNHFRHTNAGFAMGPWSRPDGPEAVDPKTRDAMGYLALHEYGHLVDILGLQGEAFEKGHLQEGRQVGTLWSWGGERERVFRDPQLWSEKTFHAALDYKTGRQPRQEPTLWHKMAVGTPGARGFVSGYAQADSRENFAETFAFFLKYRQEIRDKAQAELPDDRLRRRYRFMEQLCDPSTPAPHRPPVREEESVVWHRGVKIVGIAVNQTYLYWKGLTDRSVLRSLQGLTGLEAEYLDDVREALDIVPQPILDLLRGKDPAFPMVIYLSNLYGRSATSNRPVSIGNVYPAMEYGVVAEGLSCQVALGPEHRRQSVREIGHLVDDGISGNYHTEYLAAGKDMSVLLPWKEARDRIFKPGTGKESPRWNPQPGFLSGYAQADERENFAEHFSFYLCAREEFARVARQEKEAGNDLLQQKYDFFADLTTLAPPPPSQRRWK